MDTYVKNVDDYYYYYYAQHDKKCKIAEDNFTNCKYDSELENYCSLCKDDLYLNITDDLCYTSLGNDNFYKCAMSDINEIDCYKCIEGYYLSNKNKR